jgi:HSP20 family protein
MDVCDDPASPNIVATFELPGVKREEIKLNIHEGQLIVRGERRSRLTPLTTTPSESASSLPRHPISAADAIASGEMMETDAVAPRVTHPIQEVRYGKFQRAVPLPPGAKVSSLHLVLLQLQICPNMISKFHCS